MGVFRDWQPHYLAEGIATFPVAFVKTEEGKTDKKPLISGYLKVGTNLSSKLAARSNFADCDGIGFGVNRPFGPKITVLDIDTTDEREVPKAIERHGDTPIIVRTASQKFQLYYRHNGEKRLVRPWGENIPIDLLGGGFVVAVPSIGPQGSYQFIKGGLSDIRNLPMMQGVNKLLAKTGGKSTRRGAIKEGDRNDLLFRACMFEAKQAKSCDELLAYARAFNTANMQPNLLDTEVVRIATSAWAYQVRGENFIGGGGRLVTMPDPMFDDLLRNNKDALVLMLMIRRNHWDRDRFCLANVMAESMGWTLPRFKRARHFLVERCYLKVLHRGGRGKGDPAIFGWPQIGHPK